MAIGILRGRSNGVARAEPAAASAQHADDDRMWRFHEAALPHLNDLYTLARYLMRNPDDAEDAVQDCYLRGLRYFDSYRGPAMKPWLLAILRNICLSEFTRRGKQEPLTEYFDDEMLGEQITKWQEPQASPESVLVAQHDAAVMRRLVEALPSPFREVIVLREMNELSYKQIAAVGNGHVAPGARPRDVEVGVGSRGSSRFFACALRERVTAARDRAFR
jgi:RNA polymerase sigma-70 factor, ECF subfamily